jgi:hypothetical protein
VTETEIHTQLAAIRAAVQEDLASTSDAELRREALEDGEDVAAMARAMRESMLDAAAATLRCRMAVAKRRVAAVAGRDSALQRAKLSIDNVKRQIQDAFVRNPDLALAFREGDRQSDADWQSLHEDLISVGAIPTDSKDG